MKKIYFIIVLLGSILLFSNTVKANVSGCAGPQGTIKVACVDSNKVNIKWTGLTVPYYNNPLTNISLASSASCSGGAQSNIQSLGYVNYGKGEITKNIGDMDYGAGININVSVSVYNKAEYIVMRGQSNSIGTDNYIYGYKKLPSNPCSSSSSTTCTSCCIETIYSEEIVDGFNREKINYCQERFGRNISGDFIIYWLNYNYNTSCYAQYNNFLNFYDKYRYTIDRLGEYNTYSEKKSAVDSICMNGVYRYDSIQQMCDEYEKLYSPGLGGAMISLEECNDIINSGCLLKPGSYSIKETSNCLETVEEVDNNKRVYSYTKTGIDYTNNATISATCDSSGNCTF